MLLSVCSCMGWTISTVRELSHPAHLQMCSVCSEAPASDQLHISAYCMTSRVGTWSAQDPAVALLARDYLAQLHAAAEAHLAVLASRKFSTDPRAALAARLPTIVATANAIVEASATLQSTTSLRSTTSFQLPCMASQTTG